jgi:four helix bundle protein
MQDFRKLSVWEKAHQLVLLIYQATNDAAERRHAGLASQIHRAAASIPANIAEGSGHEGQRELGRHLGIALASSFELHYHLQLACDLDLLSRSDFAKLDARTEQVKRMLSSLRQKVQRNVGTQERSRRAAASSSSPPKTEN